MATPERFPEAFREVVTRPGAACAVEGLRPLPESDGDPRRGAATETRPLQELEFEPERREQ